MPSEIQDLKAEVAALKQRVSALEGEPVQEEQDFVMDEVVKPQAQNKDTSSNTLGVVGGVVLSLGFIFLIAYAIDQGWISRAMQITFGVLAGAGITVGGHFLHKKMDLQGSILSAVGIITAYFSIYGGYIFDSYRLATGFSFGITTTLLVLVLLAAVFLSYKQDTPVLLLEALLLSFVATFMAPYEWISLVYTSLFVAGFCALVYIKNWTAPAFIGGAITVLMTLVNVARSTDTQSFVMIGVFGALFLVLSLQRDNAAGAIATIVSAYTLSLLPLASESYSTATLLTGALCFMLYGFSAAKKHQSPLYLIAGIGFLMFWIPQQFDGYYVVNMWIVIAGLMAYAHSQNDESWLESVSAIVSILAGLSLLYQSITNYVQAASIGSFLFVAITSFFVSYFYAVQKKFQTHTYYLAGLASLVLLVLIELSKFWITLSWAALAFASLWLGLQTTRPVPKTAGFMLLGLTVAKLFVIDTISLSAGLRIIAYITLGVLLLVGSVLYRKYVQDE
jgi:uncharacterized membrane protein